MRPSNTALPLVYIINKGPRRQYGGCNITSLSIESFSVLWADTKRWKFTVECFLGASLLSAFSDLLSPTIQTISIRDRGNMF